MKFDILKGQSAKFGEIWMEFGRNLEVRNFFARNLNALNLDAQNFPPQISEAHHA